MIKDSVKKLTGRRGFLKGAAAAAGATFWADETLDAAAFSKLLGRSPTDQEERSGTPLELAPPR